MNPFQKQLVLNSGRTLYEEAKICVCPDPLCCAHHQLGDPAPPPQQVSAEEFEATMRSMIHDYSILKEGDERK